jgi:hypothetical protein
MVSIERRRSAFIGICSGDDSTAGSAAAELRGLPNTFKWISAQSSGSELRKL